MERKLTAALCIFCLLACPVFADASEHNDPAPEAVDQGVAFDFDMRAGAGASYKMTGGNADWGLGLDLLALFRITPGGIGHSIMPELGYSANIHADKVTDHYFLGGVGYGFNSEWFAAGIVPSFVIGETQGFHHGRDLGLGLRTTVFAEVPRIIGIQAHHQLVVYGGEMVNEFCFSASLNLGVIIVLMYLGG